MGGTLKRKYQRTDSERSDGFACSDVGSTSDGFDLISSSPTAGGPLLSSSIASLSSSSSPPPISPPTSPPPRRRSPPSSATSNKTLPQTPSTGLITKPIPKSPIYKPNLSLPIYTIHLKPGQNVSIGRSSLELGGSGSMARVRANAKDAAAAASKNHITIPSPRRLISSNHLSISVPILPNQLDPDADADGSSPWARVKVNKSAINPIDVAGIILKPGKSAKIVWDSNEDSGFEIEVAGEVRIDVEIDLDGELDVGLDADSEGVIGIGAGAGAGTDDDDGTQNELLLSSPPRKSPLKKKKNQIRTPPTVTRTKTDDELEEESQSESEDDRFQHHYQASNRDRDEFQDGDEEKEKDEDEDEKDPLKTYLSQTGTDLDSLLAYALVFSERSHVREDDLIREILTTNKAMIKAIRLRPKPKNNNNNNSSSSSSSSFSFSFSSDDDDEDDEDEEEDLEKQAMERWRPLCREALRRKGSMFGVIDTDIKDAENKAVPAYHYIPSQDSDFQRRTTLEPLVKPLRGVKREKKQYYWKKVGGKKVRR